MSRVNTSIERLSELAQQWFLSEPMLFAAWTTHRIVENARVATIRVGRGLIEVNPEFVRSLKLPELREVMKFEAVRIILKHPYGRRKPNAELAYEASNLAIQECLPCSLPLPSAEDRFGSDEHDSKFYEYYYQLLKEELYSHASDCAGDSWEGEQGEQGSGESGSCDLNGDPAGECDGSEGGCSANEGDSDDDSDGNSLDGDGQCDDGSEPSDDSGFSKCVGEGTSGGAKNLNSTKQGNNAKNSDGSTGSCDADDQELETLLALLDVESRLESYCDHELIAAENTANWHEDTLLTERINEVISDVEASQNWGSIAGNARELILATTVPKLDYQRVLRAFRANVLSTHRRLTRMKPSRRYGFQYMGSRRDFSTKLLFAVDVSGSVSSSDVQNAFSIINRLFKYGIESIDVIWFDTEIRNTKPVELKRALRQFEVDGRGGTAFQPLMDYLDEHRQYDGLIVFTDGIAPVPSPPQRNRRTRVVWLFNGEESWRQGHRGLGQSGVLTAFVRADR